MQPATHKKLASTLSQPYLTTINSNKGVYTHTISTPPNNLVKAMLSEHCMFNCSDIITRMIQLIVKSCLISYVLFVSKFFLLIDQKNGTSVNIYA
jgi:hypothetical protein